MPATLDRSADRPRPTVEALLDKGLLGLGLGGVG